LHLIATATFGLEAVVARELEALGYESRVVRPGWLAFRGGESAVARANLWLRASDRLLLQLATFGAADFDALFDQTAAVPWEDFLPPNARFPVRGRSVRSQLASVSACQSIVKKAIVERLKKAHRVASLPEDGPTFPVEVAILKDEATVVLDTSGAGLHKRGYRPESGAAPLKETLAAGLVLLSHWKAGRPFLDPFCGTGTLAIEAALIGLNRAPGRDRPFAAQSWRAFSSDVWKRAREEARDLEKSSLPEPIEASDRDEAVLRLARRSAAKARVASAIRFSRRDFAETESDRSYGCLITNPPYGGRSGEEDEIRRLYRSMPGVFRSLPTWSFFLLTARRDFERLLGQEPDRRRKLYNGDIECTYYQFLGPRPERAGGPAQVFGGVDDKAERQAEIFKNRLRKKAHHLRKWPSKRSTDCYRIYDRDIKEIPLSLDRYGDSLLLTPSNDRLESRTPGQHEDWLDLMAKAASETLAVPMERVFIQGRKRAARPVRVVEEGVSHVVQLPGDDAQAFPSLRVVRRWIRESASGKNVLIVGSASLATAAEAGGARSTTRIEPFPRKDRGTYDLAGIELPSLDGQFDFLKQLASKMNPDGIAYLVTRAPRPKLDLRALSHWTVQDVTAESIPEEFRNRKIQRVWRLTSRVR
ncbi:MAG: THUMP domain-containing protein, partial [Vicinamibacteria bacterium]